jgi:poly(3-hydroxyalkanoate) synthetase
MSLQRACRALIFCLVVSSVAACSGDALDPLPKEALHHRAKTSDGWEIALVQYKPKGKITGRPVLLCHGIAANDRNLDLDADHSLARWMASQGRETWTVALRGTGLSDGVDSGKGRKGGYNFDTLWREDLTAAIDFVRERSNEGQGVESVDFVGHSLGGMLAYAYLSQGGKGINALSTLGSPTRLDWGARWAPFLDQLTRAMFNGESIIPVMLSARLSMPIQGDENLVQRIFFNPKNVSSKTWRRLISIGISDFPGALAQQLLDMIKNGKFGSADGKVDYRADMSKIRIPTLVVAGKLDRVGVTPAVKDGFRALGGPKEWLLLSEANGILADYGHMDLVVGDRAASEVWPRVLEFLDRHPGESTPLVQAPQQSVQAAQK